MGGLAVGSGVAGTGLGVAVNVAVGSSMSVGCGVGNSRRSRAGRGVEAGVGVRLRESSNKALNLESGSSAGFEHATTAAANSAARRRQQQTLILSIRSTSRVSFSSTKRGKNATERNAQRRSSPPGSATQRPLCHCSRPVRIGTPCPAWQPGHIAEVHMLPLRSRVLTLL